MAALQPGVSSLARCVMLTRSTTRSRASQPKLSQRGLSAIRIGRTKNISPREKRRRQSQATRRACASESDDVPVRKEIIPVLVMRVGRSLLPSDDTCPDGSAAPPRPPLLASGGSERMIMSVEPATPKRTMSSSGLGCLQAVCGHAQQRTGCDDAQTIMALYDGTRRGVRLKRNPAPWPSSADASGRSNAELGSSLSEMKDPSVATSEDGRLSDPLDLLVLDPIDPVAGNGRRGCVRRQIREYS